MTVARPITIALVAGIALAAASADARMYQWTSRSTGTVQLSGDPPAWYRGAVDGPRVLVFDNGNLVDDTAIALPQAQREALRTAAFEEAEARQRAEALKRLERVARREERERVARERLEAERAQQAQQAAGAPPSEPGVEPADPAGLADGDVELDADAVARLKALIDEYDRRGGGGGARRN